MEKATATTSQGTLMPKGRLATTEISLARPMPSITPKTPPALVSTADSVRNWAMMVRRLAPRAFLRPISAVRSVTETSMMFITPMPPTSRDRLAMDTSISRMALVRVFRSSANSWELLAE